MKQAIKKLFQLFGYQLSRASQTSCDTFAVQSEFIQAREPVIFDIGAHLGEVARIYRAQFPLAAIHCFEPFPESFQALAKSLANDHRTLCHNMAVSNEQGTSVFNTNASSATNSLLATDQRGAAFWGTGVLDTTSQIKVTTTTIDLFCREAGVSHVDILKMDVQGAEFSVLQGATEMLKRQAISLIYTELIMCPTYEKQHKLHEYLSLLASFGYDFLDFYNPVRNHNQLIQADIMFVSSSFRRKLDERLQLS